MSKQQKLVQQENSQAIAPKAEHSFQTRPFAVEENQVEPSQGAGQGAGHSLSKISLGTPSVQAKLTIGQVGDRYEQEADQVAAQVVQRLNAPAQPIQREAVPEEEELQMKPILQRKAVPKEIQMKSTQLENIGGGDASADLESAINSARGSGQPIESNLQAKMGQAIGADFSDVKIHTDSQSDQLNQSIQAKAFTTGKDIFFRQGEYNPSSTGGQELLAHELTHVVQQNGSAVQRREGGSQQTIQREPDAKRTGSQFVAAQDQGWVEDTFQQLKSWDKIKTQFGSDLPTMWQFFDFRQYYVDAEIAKLREKYKGLIAKSVGSQDPTSDYDITISTPGSGDDVKAITEFNDAIKAKFGVQPGTLFDTNLYAKDYLKVEENIDESSKLGQSPDSNLDQPGDGFGKMGGLSQDVASLVKQRRYMNQTEWDTYVDSVVDGIEDKEQKQITRHQYEEADSIYQISAHELLNAVMDNPAAGNKKVIDKVNRETKLDSEAEKIIAQQPPELRSMVREELLGIKKLQGVTHEKSDLVLEKSNKLYLERMAKIREIQELIRILDPEANADEVQTLKAEVKQLLGEACFFAAEAYHSEGAVKHIVAGVQGAKNPTAKAVIMKELKPEHYLQSFNEQLGDFLKDLSHYAQEANGKIFYRASKYLYRLFLAVAELREFKDEFSDLAKLQIEQTSDSAAIAKDINQKLVSIRKGDGEFQGMPEEAKIERAQTAMQEILNVSTASALKIKILQMAQEFNGAVRTKAKDLSAPDPETSKKYFANIH